MTGRFIKRAQKSEDDMRTIVIFWCGFVAWTMCVPAGAAQGRGGEAPDRAAGRIVGRALVRGTPTPPARVPPDSEGARIATAGLYQEAVVADAARGLANRCVFVEDRPD